MKRAGRLVYFTCGDGALTALDVMTGAVVWRLRDRLRFRTPPTVAHDALFVVSGGAHGVAQPLLHRPLLGPRALVRGARRPHAPCTVEGAPLVADGAVAVAVRQKTALGPGLFRATTALAIGHRERRRAAGSSRRARRAPRGSPSTTRSSATRPPASSSRSTREAGELRWRHVLGPRPLEADVPRRLEPVLRCGALFVPCSLVSSPASSPPGAAALQQRESGGVAAAAGVCIVRPADGAILGSIAPTETIPDLLRVDEHCHVYIAEESGHLATFAALPRLSLVPSARASSPL